MDEVSPQPNRTSAQQEMPQNVGTQPNYGKVVVGNSSPYAPLGQMPVDGITEPAVATLSANIQDDSTMHDAHTSAPVETGVHMPEATMPIESAGQDALSSRLPVAPNTNAVIHWTTPEVNYTKNSVWYAMVALATIALTTIIFLFTRDVILSGLIVVVMPALALLSVKKPHSSEYAMDEHGVMVGQKVYEFHDFKSFSVIDEAQAATISLMPLKRFMPTVMLYMPQQVRDQVVSTIANSLPENPYNPDMLDSMIRKLRF